VDFVQGYLFGRPRPKSGLDFSSARPNGRQVA